LADFAQFVASGLTRGAIYALVGMGFAIVFNASNLINFAQGEFVMLGGMLTALLVTTTGLLPSWAAVPLAVVAAGGLGALLYALAIRPAGRANLATLIIITLGASILIRGVVQVTLGKQDFMTPPFSGEAPVRVLGAAISTQSLWVLGALALTALALKWFFDVSVFGRAMRATAQSPLAASLVGIDVHRVLMASFALAAALGALAGALITPISLTRYDLGITLGLKGFAAGMLGGLNNPFGALGGGLLLGLAESLTGGYVSSGYQDAVAFVIIVVVLCTRPQGLFGRSFAERV
jgi:branched-chain amino acid transport system permease protein